MKKVFEIKSVKGVIIKNLFEVIKPYIKETVLIVDKTGIKMTTVDLNNTSLTYIKLNADKFEVFNCHKPMRLGIDTTIFFKSIKSVSRSETIEFFMNENEEHKLHIKLVDLTGKIKEYIIPLLLIDINENTPRHPDELNFQSIINIPSTQFQQIVKDIHGLEGKIVEIKNINKQLVFECNDGIAGYRTIINELDKTLNKDQQELLQQNGEKIRSVKFVKSSNEIIQGKFQVANLMNYIKASHLCDNMLLLFENDKPLILEYQVADIGILRMVLANVN